MFLISENDKDKPKKKKKEKKCINKGFKCAIYLIHIVNQNANALSQHDNVYINSGQLDIEHILIKWHTISKE